MQKERKLLFRCNKCGKHLGNSEKIDNCNYSAKCGCSSYICLNSILYFSSDKYSRNAIRYFREGKILSALAELCRPPKKLQTLIQSLLKFRSVDRLLYFVFFKKNLIKKIGFRRVIDLLSKISLSKQASYYFKKRTSFPSYFMSIVSAKLVRNKSEMVLDIGCGTGQFLKYLSKKVNQENIVGLDKSFINCLLARIFFAPPKTLLICADVENDFPFDAKTFNILFSVDNFHYISDKSGFIKSAGNILKDNGKLVVIKVSNTFKFTKLILPIKPSDFKKILFKNGFLNSEFISDNSFWDRISKLHAVNLISPVSTIALAGSDLYSVIASKKKIPEKLILDKSQISFLKSNKWIVKEHLD